ncbi:MAG: ferritin-like domain-containing protein [Pseudomonadota bacterium]|nr:ferritin-like domain-containing protein [Pseudomonadota bacterium]
MAIKSMHDLFVESLRDIYHAEKQALRAYPKLLRAVQDEQLKQAFEQHREETQGQIERLEQVFRHLDTRARGKPCHAMEGLIEEAKEHLEAIQDPEVRDAAILAEAQKMEHYEISSYGTMAALARQLGLNDVLPLIEQTLEEEKKTDQILNKIALSRVNRKAAA